MIESTMCGHVNERQIGVTTNNRWWTVAVMSCSTAVLILLARVAPAQIPDTTLWVTGPGTTVLAVVRLENTLYIGGNFRTVGPSTGAGVPVDLISGAVRAPYSRVAGGVAAAIPDGAGGWFVGGGFAGVGGLPRWNLAHIQADGSVDAWAPDPDGTVFALALRGNVLYVGGRFNKIAGKARAHLAAFDVLTGGLTDWAPEANGYVFEIFAPSDTIYVGGSFGTIGGESRSCIAALDAMTGHATSWNPGADDVVSAFALHGRTLYVSGAFYNIGGRFGRFLAELSLDSDSASTWGMNVDQRPPNWLFPPGVAELEISGDTLYVGGRFTEIGGQQRNGLAAIDLQTRSVTAWAPQVIPLSSVQPAQIDDLHIRGTTLYACGLFRSLGGRVISGDGSVGAVDTRTGLATAWDPRPNGGVLALGMSDEAIYVGGGYTSIGPEWVWRHGLAALDLTTGRATLWDPNPDEAYVLSLAASGNTVYVGGSFSRVGGQPRANLAAFDVRDGTLTPWNPAPNGGVVALEASGNTIYAGGQFTGIGGQPRRYLAAVDSATGAATPWDPDPDDFVEAITAAGNIVYAGGWFAHMRGLPRKTLAAIDPATGETRDWDAYGSGVVDAIAVKEDTIFVGGMFSSLGGRSKRDLVGVDARTGLATDWNPVLGPGIGGGYSDVRALQLQGNTLYIGGDFGSVNGVTRNYLAALDATTGELKDNWDPNPDGFIWALALGPHTVYAAGAYERMNGVPVGSIAALSAIPTNGPRLPSGVLWVSPNPVSSSATLRFALAGAAAVTLAVYDVQGRRVATLLDRSPMSGGEHVVPLPTSGWPVGCYLARLDIEGVTATRKMVVVR
ncbi:MAG: PQQ-binding-like beta-propeller repeat protein [Candidatus Eisenbacteria bacterium]|nr:PQQ-binding-like beta-propeller repeat protein [Candidatus Eisenbacteria bacterium]